MKPLKPETMLAHAGLNKNEPCGAISTPIYTSSTFRHPEPGASTGYDYSRTLNPTREVLEKAIAGLEGGTAGFAFSTGMAALTAVLSLFSSGDHIAVSDDLYGGTWRIFTDVFSRFNLSVSPFDVTDISTLNNALTEKTKAILIETPTNPMMKIADIKALSNIAKDNSLLLIVDNTVMTPFLQRPIELGADIVIHSGTKYLGGHNDVLCGLVVCATPGLAEKTGFIQNATGGVLSPFDSWLVIRGMKTLALRIKQAQENALLIVEWLTSHDKVTKIYYPGLIEHPGHEIQISQASGPGAMISFRVNNRKTAEAVINRVQVISFAESLGGVESLITYPMHQTHGAVPEEIKKRLGIDETLLRLSVGIENAVDLIGDIGQALGQDD